MLSFTRPKALVFDVNETLLDLSSLQQAFTQTFDEPFAFKYWFSTLLQYSLVDTLTTNYHDFGQIGQAALTMTGTYFDKPLSPDEQQRLLANITELRPHPDVEPGLKQLKEAGFRLVTLTNSPPKTLGQQMANTGLNAYFESLWSVDDARVFKPHPQTYKLALSRLQLPPEQTMMIACHAWDLAGAAQAGMQTGFIARPGQSLYALAPAPTLTGKTLTDLAAQLV